MENFENYYNLLDDDYKDMFNKIDINVLNAACEVAEINSLDEFKNVLDYIDMDNYYYDKSITNTYQLGYFEVWNGFKFGTDVLKHLHDIDDYINYEKIGEDCLKDTTAGFTEYGFIELYDFSK